MIHSSLEESQVHKLRNPLSTMNYECVHLTSLLHVHVHVHVGTPLDDPQIDPLTSRTE